MRNQASVAKFGIVAVALATFLFAAAHTASPDANTIAVDSITIAANQLTLKGVFGSGAATVLLGSNSLPVVSSSPSEVVATLNPVPALGPTA
jgi:hypothetical protein